MAGHAHEGGPAFLVLMKRFRFPLQSVRDLRHDRETAARQELAERLRAHQAAHTAAEASLARHRLALQRLEHAATSGAALRIADQDRVSARLRLEQDAIGLRHAGGDVDRARERLVAARQALETVQRLEAKQRAAHRAAALAEDERVIAEIVEARAARAAMAARGRR
jgi:flagellar export protein FliJ